MKHIKSKTTKFNLDLIGYRTFSFCNLSPFLHKKGLKRKIKEPLLFFVRDIACRKYEQLPNGRYYEYRLTNVDHFKGKPCKYYYILDENKSKIFVGFELYEDIHRNFININELHFDVKGGKLNYLKKPKKKSAKAHKRHTNKATDSSPTAHRRVFTEKYIQFIQGHKRMGHISQEVYGYAMLILRKCAGLNFITPHKFKTLLCDVYSQDSKVNKSTAEKTFIQYAKKAYKKTGKESIYH